jgi:polysaccharide export outer membrane protein
VVSDNPRKRDAVAWQSLLPVAALLLAFTISCAAEIAPPPYRVQAGDTLNIQVLGHPEWTLEVIVRPDGRVAYPSLGEIEVAGLTIEQLTAQIVDALGPKGHHLKDPQVVINLRNMRPAQVYVLGAVARPGMVELATGVETAKKVLAMVGGPQPQADLREVTIYRGSAPKQVFDLQAQLGDGAADTLLHAGDVVVVPEVQERYVGVLGAIAHTGQIRLRPGDTSVDVSELVVQLGGLTPNADKERALILRAQGPVEVISIEKVLKREAPPVRVNAGDVLWVLPQPDTEYFVVTGAVNSPGRFEHRQGITLADALALAGQTSQAAETKSVTLIHRDGSKQVVDIRPMLAGKDTDTARLAVAPDDIILVPLQHESYVVLGAVGKPGIYPWDEKVRLADALALAGGPVERTADLANVFLVRRSEGAKKPVVMHLNAKDLLIGRNEAANWALQPGDTIYVPSRDEKDWRQKLDVPLLLLGIAGTITNLFRFN